MPSVFLDIKGGMPTVSQSHGTSGSISYETIPPVSLETSGGVLSIVDMVMRRRGGPRRLRDSDDDDACDQQTDAQIDLTTCLATDRIPCYAIGL